MSCLHLITTPRLPEGFVTLSNEGDEAVLLAEGVYLTTSDTHWQSEFAKVFVIRDELVMRGLPDSLPGYSVINNEELVSLILKHEKSITWS